MKKHIKITFLLLITILLNSCETCYECVKCTSFDENNEVVKEVFDCSTKKGYLNGFVAGFKKSAEDQGYTAECLTNNVKCE